MESNARRLIEEFHHKRGDNAPWKMDTNKLSHTEVKELWKRNTTMQLVLDRGQASTRASDLFAELDLYSAEEVTISKETNKLVNLEIRFQVPHGTYEQIAPRSSLAMKGIHVGAEVIDRDYTGTVKVLLLNTSDLNFTVLIEDRIAQLILERIDIADIELVDSLPETKRAERGFGSTGK